MKILIHLYLILLLSQIFLLKATIVEIEELYNPKINQTIILFGDFHIDCDNDTKQIEAIVTQAKKYNAYTMIEYKDFINPKLLLSRLYNQLLNEKMVSVDGMDFRDESIWFLMTESLEYKTFQQVYDHWHTFETKNLVFDTFIKVLKSGIDIRNELESYLKTMPSQDRKYIEFIEKTIQEGGDLFYEIWKLKPQKKNGIYEIDPMVDFIFNNIFIKKQDGTFELNSENIIDKLVQSHIALMDAWIIKNIHQHKNDRILFLIFGQGHTAKISNVLQDSGFILKNKKSVAVECSQTFKALVANKPWVMCNAMKNEALEQYCFNLDDFFNKIETFPKNNKSVWSKLMYIPNLILTGIYSINSWLHKQK